MSLGAFQEPNFAEGVAVLETSHPSWYVGFAGLDGYKLEYQELAGSYRDCDPCDLKKNWEDANKILASKGVTLLSAGLDEVPTVYKNIDKVMEEQQDLVDIQAQFDPKLVKMAPSGERPED